MSELSRLRICFIAGTLGQGGAERQLYYMTSVLRKRCAHVEVLCLTQGEFWEPRISELGVGVTWVGRRGSKAGRLGRIIDLLRGHRPDVIQSQHFYTNLYAAGAARVLGAREVGALRNDGAGEVTATGMLLGRLSLRIPRLVAANSRAAIETAKKLGVRSDRLRFLANVVDTTAFKPGPASSNGPTRLLAVGRLEPQKRLDRFISILASIKERTSCQIKATIVGDGPERQMLTRQAEELGLVPGTIEFAGAVNNISEVYMRADVLALTSDWEGTPNAVLEAMAAGLPVVATRVGGVPEVVQAGETGFLVEPDDTEAFTESLLGLINNPQLRTEMGKRARRYVEANHSPDRLLESLASIYGVHPN